MMTMGSSLNQGKEDGIKTAENRHSIFLEEFGFERLIGFVSIRAKEM